MHEVHIVRELVAEVERQATAAGARRVSRVRLRYNPLVSHDAEHVQFCFDVVKRDSALLKEATLELSRIPGTVQCQQCRHQFEPEELPDVCPKCGSVGLAPLHPMHLELEGFDPAP